MSEITEMAEMADHAWQAEPRATMLDTLHGADAFCAHRVDPEHICIRQRSQHPAGPGFTYEVRVPATLNRERRAEQAMVLILRGNAEQVTDFLNRPGDYYDRTFHVTTVPPETPKGFLGDPEPDEQSDTETVSANMAAMAGHTEPTPRFEVRRSSTARPGLHYVFDNQRQAVVKDYPNLETTQFYAKLLNEEQDRQLGEGNRPAPPPGLPPGWADERRAGAIDLDDLEASIRFTELAGHVQVNLEPTALVLRAAKAFLALDRAGLIRGRRDRS